ncbi:MAG TPA: cysteine desulfurase [Kofleriaceae bacterium]|nr:cysteine desulfurase [Kofleriaceae bacterium]
MPSRAEAITAAPSVSLDRVRAAFPALAQKVNGHPLVYLDSAATALKPQSVIDAATAMYAVDCANIHRAVHKLSQRATAAFENARAKVARFIGAGAAREVVFVRGTTEAINLVAQCYARPRLGPGDEILITGLEHHSNIVPWQMVCEQTGAKLVVAPMDDRGDVPLAGIEARLGKNTKVVAVAHVSNALGTVLPVRAIARLAHDAGAAVVVDGAQAAPHLAVDVADLDCDFYALSGHKLYGPSGIGALYGRAALLSEMPPYQGGGDMILSVTFERTLYNDIPHKFEAGTPHIAGAVGLGAAIDFVSEVGLAQAAAHEESLLAYAHERLGAIPGVRLIGTAPKKIGVVSFVMESAHPHDVGTVIDAEGIAIRTGHHCAQPVIDHFGVPATCRASFGMYNTTAEVDALCAALGKVNALFG